ncbi:serine/threonine protein kinase [Marinitenerispora sediminis]|uniref:non-specific serine/threonine protein kinase n=1 Tax=Marinitenerispora sediminis TaxID=1931232 RepID=A0A368SZ32_9ACTN|nr:serine/threonine protein kinase [Marinitenerispora sediminis]RCV50378.1 serine/threonine protein kinase [Marinitenerispora sediminis]RCV57455.1 serine/threonine protein kinase [Marinitenerispora sediminis]
METLGAGGMGEVWKGIDERLERPVAVKLVRPDLADGADTVARFQREARVTALLAGHPNIVVLYDYGTEGDWVYAVMELVAGRTLTAVLAERGPLPIPLAAAWGAQICAGLAAAHAAGVVHRDVKPGNLMVVERSAGGPAEDTLKMLDFGIAGFREAAVHSRPRARTDLIGTPLYMSPEQIQGQPAGVAGDLYSFGAILYEMLTGRAPFRAPEPLPVMRMHLVEPPRPPERLRAGIPPELSALVAELLAKSPDQRPGSAEEVRDRLLAAAGAEPEPAGSAAGVRRRTAARAARAELRRRLADVDRHGTAGDPGTAARELDALIPDLEHSFGADHLATLRARSRRAYLSGKSGSPAAAVDAFTRVVADLERAYGPRHPETLTARHYLATNTGRAGHYERAARIHGELIPDLAAVHGADSARVLISRLHEAVAVGESGDFARAAGLLDDLVPLLERAVGPDAADTFTARHYRAAYAGRAGDCAAAVRLYDELLADHVRARGTDHPRTARLRARRDHWRECAR